MSKKSSTDRIKGLNPKNVSGTVPQGLDLIQQLQKVQGNPNMIQAVGLQNLMGMLQFVAQKFSQNQVKDVLTLDKILNAMDIQSLGIERNEFVRLAKELLGVLNFDLVLKSPLAKLESINTLLVNNPDIPQVMPNRLEVLNITMTQLRKILSAN